MAGITVLLILVAGASFGTTIYLYQKLKTIQEQKPEQLSELEAIEKASSIAKEKILEAEKKASQIERDAQSATDKAKHKLRQQERDLTKKEEKLAQKSMEIDEKYDLLDKKEKEIDAIRNEAKSHQDKLKKEIERVANLSEREARELLEERISGDIQTWVSKQVKDAETELKKRKVLKAQEILSTALLNASVEYTAETTTTTVEIGDESMKGRIIGKEGRNIRTFQDRTGVDLIMDESPTQVTISSFDPIRREVGALALKRLIKDGKIHPASIEETIERVKKDLLKEIKKTGEEIAFETGFNDLSPELIMLLGRFKYRYSKGLNLIKHTLEVVKLSEILAKELGANKEKAKLAALLHDIGKVQPEDGKQYFEVTVEIADKYIKDQDVINALKAQNPDFESNDIIGQIIEIADTISTTRPGAQKSNYEEYIRRLRSIEDVANSEPGVKQTFALKAGKDVKVLVEPKGVPSEELKALAFKIAKNIEETQSVGGPVKVTVLREYRTSAEAS